LFSYSIFELVFLHQVHKLFGREDWVFCHWTPLLLSF
jgi:hypothetical protein